MSSFIFRPIGFATTLSLLTSALFAANTAYSAPTVNGQTISWPDDGWYQVQTAGTYQEVCAGGRSCEVEPGAYIVINHSTGERFNTISVSSGSGGGEPEPSVTAVTVSGQTISWPDDGWYQVQTADTYEQVCAGGRSCEVEPGVYIVINHSTGERFNNISVRGGSSGGEPEQPATAVTVNGQTISWPDDGWYQVQEAETYLSVCQGGAECEVTSGSYIVINHTTGQRTHVEVPVTTGSSITAANLDAILSSVLAVPSSNGHTQVVSDIDVFASVDTHDVSGLSLLERVSTDEGLTFSSRIECDAGGMFEHKATSSLEKDINLIFDECVYAGRRFNGQVDIYYTSAVSGYDYQSLDVVSLEDGATVLVNGSYTRFAARSGSFEGETYNDLSYSIDGEAGITSVTGMDQSTEFSANEDANEEPTTRFETHFVLVAPWTNSQSVEISTIEPFQDVDNELYLAGQLQVIDADGNNPENTLVIDANTGDINTFLVVLNDQGAVTSEIRNWADYPMLPSP